MRGISSSRKDPNPKESAMGLPIIGSSKSALIISLAKPLLSSQLLYGIDSVKLGV